MNIPISRRRVTQCVVLAAMCVIVSQGVNSQVASPPEDFARLFKYNIENIVLQTTTPGTWDVKVIFSVTNPTTLGNDAWDIKTAAPFQSAGARLAMDIGWDPSTDFTNTGSANRTGPAYPIQMDLAAATRCVSSDDCPGVVSLNDRFWVSRTVSPVTFMRPAAFGRVIIEGRPVCNGLDGCPAGPPFANIPVKSEFADFSLANSATPTSAMVGNVRRPVVDIRKCQVCHDGTVHEESGGDDGEATPIPRLLMHGANRNENLGICVVCHNPNQTDAHRRSVTLDPRTSGPEAPVDYKRMVHAIHGAEKRETPFVVIGPRSLVFDFSDVVFPAKLRNCLNCHIDVNGRGTFELPLRSTVLGTTVKTGSVYEPADATRVVDVNPFNDLKISPTAAVCSACHDDAETRSHMIRTGGASFGTLQETIGSTVIERCAGCHGPGRDKDVRHVHNAREEQ